MTEFGSCLYESIKIYMEKFKNKLPLWTKIDLYDIKTICENKGSIEDNGNIKLAFSSTIINEDVLSSIISNIKKAFLKKLSDQKEFYNKDEILNFTKDINNIKTVDDCYIYCRNNSWDLWSANNFIINRFYKRNGGDFSDNYMIAISILWLLENNIVKDTTCFYNFDT